MLLKKKKKNNNSLSTQNQFHLDEILQSTIKLKIAINMSSPLYKHTNENLSSAKQRKVKSTNAAKSTTNIDSRSELADLIKRKAEIAVSFHF